MRRFHRIMPSAMIFLSASVGGGSLLLLLVFLYIGSFGVITLNLNVPLMIFWNALLCLLFFSQHSMMIRKSFRNRFLAVIPTHYQKAFYSFVSGMTLAVLMIFWQPSFQMFWRLEGYGLWLTRVGFFLSITGFMWGGLTLKSFDPLGLETLSGSVNRLPVGHLVIRGPYRWVRHPLYLFTLVMIWSCPNLSTDRLLFNLLFSSWILLGTVWEEKDLVADYGDAYRKYQNRVPMLIPRRLLPPVSSRTNGV